MCRLCDIALTQQRIQIDQQVKIHAIDFHRKHRIFVVNGMPTNIYKKNYTFIATIAK